MVGTTIPACTEVGSYSYVGRWYVPAYFVLLARDLHVPHALPAFMRFYSLAGTD